MRARATRFDRGRGWAVVLAGGLLLGRDALAAEGDLVLVPDLPMLTALLIFFALLVYPLNALLFKPIFAVLDAREERIEGTRARAEKLASEAEQILARYQGEIARVREEAEVERKETLGRSRQESATQAGAARAEADREIEHAREAIAGALGGARAELRAQAELLAREAATRVLGRPVS